MTSQLTIYNGALLLHGERFLHPVNGLTEETKSRRLLDQVWDTGGVRACLERGQWFFAMRTTKIDYDITEDPAFGYQYAFAKPDDWVITSAVCSDEYFNSPLTQYVDEAGFWYSDLQELYVRYVSDDTGYGLAYARWPEGFREYVEAHFAYKIAFDLDKENIAAHKKYRDDCLLTAQNNNLMAGPTTFPARGTWTRGRSGQGSNRDRGNTGSLIG